VEILYHLIKSPPVEAWVLTQKTFDIAERVFEMEGFGDKKVHKSENGSVLLSVVFVLFILIMLCIGAVSVSFSSFQSSLAAGNITDSYTVSDSVLEKSINYIDEMSKDSQIASGIYYTGDSSLAQAVVMKIKEHMESIFGENPDSIYMETDIYGTGTLARSYVDIEKISEQRSSIPGEYNRLIIKIGITVQSGIDKGLRNSGLKNVYGEFDIEIETPGRYYLNAAITSIGDIMATGSGTYNIDGDIRSYGTSPVKVSRPEQYYYGGIIAKNNAELNIKGNAYTRSMIRTGVYLSDNDNSTVNVYKDAIAGGIQNFSDNSSIIIFRNAYTFDDIEINGENSFICINGSYFGLSRNEAGMFHDNSSAVVSSSSVHNAGSQDSKKSRVIINGDVYINGGTFKLDINDIAIGQIEDASVAWTKNTGSPSRPVYKYLYDPVTYHEDLINLYDQNLINGYSNLFQVFDIIPVNNYDEVTQNEKDEIESWVQKAKNASLSGSNNSLLFDKQNAYISGITRYEVAANDSMYFRDYTGDGSENQIKRTEYENISYIIPDNIPGIQSSFWDNVGEDWLSYKSDNPMVANSVFNKLNDLKDYLMPLTEEFVKRETDFSEEEILHQGVSAPATGDGDNLYTYIKNKFYEYDETVFINILKIPGEGTPVERDLSEYMEYLLPENEDYYLILVDDPDLTLEISGKINGLIFSMGQIRLLDGCDIEGAVMSAGRGFSEGAPGYAGGSAADDTVNRIPKILENGENINSLNNGLYAGVYMNGNSISVFFPGREQVIINLALPGLDGII
jgi:hypothetical protein